MSEANKEANGTQPDAPQPLKENGVPVRLHYRERICPDLSQATLRTDDRNLVQGVGQNAPSKASALPCAGIKCMLFIPEVDAQGNIVNGMCAKTNQAMQMGQIASALGMLIEASIRASGKKGN